jgi:alpha-1,3-rhamnosyl/mannosyltransferase
MDRKMTGGVQPHAPAAPDTRFAMRGEGRLSVIVDAESLRPPLTGIGRYVRHLLAGLVERTACIERVDCFSGPSWMPAADCLRASAGPAPDRTGARGLARALRGIPGVYEARHMAMGLILKARAPALPRNAVYHEPNYVLRPIPAPAVVSCHDLSFVRHPEHHPRERVRHLERHLPRSLEQASKILTDSDHVRREVIACFGIEPAKIITVPLGVERAFRPYGVEESRSALKRQGLVHGSYLLTVTTVEPRKNLSRLIEAYEMLPPAMRRRFPLVVAGAKGWSTAALETRMSRLQRAGELKRLGYVPDEDLPSLYAGCAAFAYPSLYEGFGLPPLEAMACGVPVVASDTTSIPEVMGDAGIMVDPEDVASIAQGLQRAVEDEELRSALRSKGPARAALFTWDRCVERTIEVYRDALG